MSTLRETCCCGAELDAADRYDGSGGLSSRADEFRKAHTVCRERPPVLPALAVGPSATGANALLFPTSFWHAHDDTADALAVLTRMACPAPCVGVVNDTGWHLECERKAREALAILRAGHYPDDEPPASDLPASVSPEQTPSPEPALSQASDHSTVGPAATELPAQPSTAPHSVTGGAQTDMTRKAQR